jgi:hypothetical protein
MLAVRQALRDTGAARLIPGHTHRPGVHEVLLQDRTAERIVFADWRDGRGEALWIGAEGGVAMTGPVRRVDRARRRTPTNCWRQLSPLRVMKGDVAF